MINPKSTDWTQEEKDVTVAALEKLTYCQKRGVRVPGEVFEAHADSKKNISTELGIFRLMDGEMELYLARRPSLEKNPSEPYPGTLHVPGATHGRDESTADTFIRLQVTEHVSFERPTLVWEPDDFPADGKRGRYLSRIYVALATGEQTNPAGKFYPLHAIPWGEVQDGHRDIIIPAIIKFLTKEVLA